MDEEIKTVKIDVFGIVQGVGFRWATIQVAKHFNIAGWVQNKPDGSVEIVAQGPLASLTQFAARIQESPTPYAKIHSITTNYITKSRLKGFNVKY